MSAVRSLPIVLLALALAASPARRICAGPATPVIQQMDQPALDVLETEVLAVSAARLPLPKGGAIEQSALDADFDYTRRVALAGNWYLAFGAAYEGFLFDKTQAGLPQQLQGIAGIMALQYIVQDHVAATLELRPGVYAGGGITSDALDVPVLAYAPIPLRADLFLVLGARYSSLQNPPVVPIGGLVWLIRDDLRLEAIFPQSHFVYSPSDHWEFQLQAEVAGDGFRVDRDPALPERLRGGVVEYSEYRTGAGVNYTPRKGATLGFDAGYVFERSLDFFRAGTDLRSGGSAYLRLQASLEF